MPETTILDRWLEQTGKSHPAEAARFFGAETDPFRNPMGYALRQNLGILLEEVLGEMKPEAVQAALENIIRIRAVQDLSPSQALQFVFELKPLLRKFMKDANPDRLDAHVDQLALRAFDEYSRCRERLAELRLNESRRALCHAATLREPGSRS
jgi:hypothetical protein